MKITSNDLDIVKKLEAEEGDWLDGNKPKFFEIANQSISIEEDPSGTFDKNPEFILKTIRLAGETGYRITPDTLEAMNAQKKRLKIIPRNKLRDSFEGIITSPDASHALQFAMELDLLPYVLGDPYVMASKSSKKELAELFEGIDKARPEPEHRWALVMRRFDIRTAENMMMSLMFRKDLAYRIMKTHKHIEKLYFLNTKMELKQFILKQGYDDYVFIDKISRQEKKIFDRMDYKVESRHYMLEEIKNCNEPLYTHELAVDANDLIEAKICKNEEDAENMLGMLLDLAVRRPRWNTKEMMLKKAKNMKRNPILVWTRKVHWIK